MRSVLFYIPPFQKARIRRGAGKLVAIRAVALVLFAPLFAMLIGHAQQAAPVERAYKHPQVEVERALRDLGAYATAPLPALDGFVNADSNNFDLYDNPHYEFRVKVTEQAPEQTLVSLSARVTAWYSNALPSESRYVLLPSNGRLEKELLDRLTAYLEKGNARQPSGSTSMPTASAVSSAASPSTLRATGAAVSNAANATTIKPADPVAPMGDFSHADPATLSTEIAKVQAERVTTEEEEKKLQQQVSQLEADRKGRRYLNDLAMIKGAQTPVFEQNNEFSKVLFRADPEDEFVVTEARFGWVRVRLETLGQGWIRINDLQLPNEKDDTDESADFAEPNEEVAPFTGSWALLKDKPTLFVVAQPKHAIPTGSLGQSQIEFAKRAFVDGYRSAAHSQGKIDGVAVVFLGDKAGMAAATLTEIGRWQKGTISDKLFLERCFLSPPDAFRDLTKH
jgi:hypothetical protein